MRLGTPRKLNLVKEQPTNSKAVLQASTRNRLHARKVFLWRDEDYESSFCIERRFGTMAEKA
jgi:hypothetical protein